MNFTSEPLPDDEYGRAYAEVSHQLWLSKLRKLSPRTAAECDSIGQDFSYNMRYQDNAPKVWFTPTTHIAIGLDQPLAEPPVSKDKWVSIDATVLTHRRCQMSMLTEAPNYCLYEGIKPDMMIQRFLEAKFCASATESS
jgi:hypothetical protein